MILIIQLDLIKLTSIFNKNYLKVFIFDTTIPGPKSGLKAILIKKGYLDGHYLSRRFAFKDSCQSVSQYLFPDIMPYLKI